MGKASTSKNTEMLTWIEKELGIWETEHKKLSAEERQKFLDYSPEWVSSFSVVNLEFATFVF